MLVWYIAKNVVFSYILFYQFNVEQHKYLQKGLTCGFSKIYVITISQLKHNM